MKVQRNGVGASAYTDRRMSNRRELQCRARIRIANRQYSGFLSNLSEGGAKLRTASPIRKLGRVVLQLPDLPPLLCEIRWNDHCNAVIRFGVLLPTRVLSQWTRARTSRQQLVRAGDAEPA